MRFVIILAIAVTLSGCAEQPEDHAAVLRQASIAIKEYNATITAVFGEFATGDTKAQELTKSD